MTGSYNDNNNSQYFNSDYMPWLNTDDPDNWIEDKNKWEWIRDETNRLYNLNSNVDVCNYIFCFNIHHKYYTSGDGSTASTGGGTNYINVSSQYSEFLNLSKPDNAHDVLICFAKDMWQWYTPINPLPPNWATTYGTGITSLIYTKTQVTRYPNISTGYINTSLTSDQNTRWSHYGLSDWSVLSYSGEYYPVQNFSTSGFIRLNREFIPEEDYPNNLP